MILNNLWNDLQVPPITRKKYKRSYMQEVNNKNYKKVLYIIIIVIINNK